MNEYKTCARCGQIKTAGEFSPDRRALSGLQTRCKTCLAQLAREKRLREPEKSRLLQREWRLANPAADKARKLRYKLKNPDKAKQYAAEYRIENPEKTAKAMSRWRKSNPDKVRLYSTRRRAWLKAAKTFEISPREMWHLYNDQCFYCDSQSQTIDHVIPLSRGGNHGIGNLVPCCFACNNSKNNKFITEWKKVRLL
jgi:5-methylcytosine-specific restriction endonuclease McrA